MAKSRPRSVYQLRLHLRGVSPPVWRRVLVPSASTIAELHNVIQATMGWGDVHLHQFTIRGQIYGVPQLGAANMFAGPPDLKLQAFEFRPHDRFEYEYDFYSNWVHDIRVEGVDSAVGSLPRCIGGVGACPPEDAGPPARFMELKAGHSVFRMVDWLKGELARNTPMDEIREALAERLPWANVWFGNNEELRACYESWYPTMAAANEDPFKVAA